MIGLAGVGTPPQATYIINSIESRNINFSFFSDMETDKPKTEEEPQQNIYVQYIQGDSDWHNWLCYIKGVIKRNGLNCEFRQRLSSELEMYMLDSVLGKKWYECECPDLMDSNPMTARFLYFWEFYRKCKVGKPTADIVKRVDECNLFFMNYSKLKYLKSVGDDAKDVPDEFRSVDFDRILEKAIASKLIKKTPNGYDWMRTNVLFAYFAKIVSRTLRMTNKEYNGELSTSWKPFENFFLNKNGEHFKKDALKIAMQDWMKKHGVNESKNFYPENHEDIDQCICK